jgi:hypothetical protein
MEKIFHVVFEYIASLEYSFYQKLCLNIFSNDYDEK